MKFSWKISSIDRIVKMIKGLTKFSPKIGNNFPETLCVNWKILKNKNKSSCSFCTNRPESSVQRRPSSNLRTAYE